jgi:spermidine synthase
MPSKKNRVSLTHFLDGVGISLEGLELLTELRSRKYLLSLYRHPHLGKVLVLDGEIQHVEAWSALYHEILIHLSASFVPVLKNVAVFGGGSLFAAFEALKYMSVEEVVMLDHDPGVFETIAKFYPHARMCLNDPRLRILEKNAYVEVLDQRGKFDLVINDAADLLAVKASSPKTNIFSLMARALRPKGVCADVIQRHVFERRHVSKTLVKLRALRHALSLVFLPEYHGVLHLLTIWGKKSSFINQQARKPINREQLNWLREPRKSPCVYYAPRFLPYYLYLPRYLSKAAQARRRTA